MAKIIKSANKFKPITCGVCGCVYEFEKGDDITFTKIVNNWDGKTTVVNMLLTCPFCNNSNVLEKEDGE